MEKSTPTDVASPPPYVEAPIATTGRVENRPQGTNPSQQAVFLDSARSLRLKYEAESLRDFLFTLLKIDYHDYFHRYEGQVIQRPDADLTFGLYYQRLVFYYRKEFPDATQPSSEINSFLESIADLLESLKLKAEHVYPMISEYGILTENGKQYRSALDAFQVEHLPYKLVRDRTHLIDALVPRGDTQSRAELHRALQKAQTQLFTFIQNPEDYQLTFDGAERQQRERRQQEKKDKAAAKEQRAIAKRQLADAKRQGGHATDHRCVQS